MKKFFLLPAIICLMIQPSLFAWEKSLHPATAYRQRSFRGWTSEPVSTVSFNAWRTGLEGDVNIDGLNLDLEDEADFGAKTRFGVNLSHAFSLRSSVSLAYNSLDHSGHTTRGVTFQKQNYQPNASIRIKNYWFDVKYSHLLSVWGDAAKREENGSFIDALAGIKFVNTELNVSGRDALNGIISGGWDQNFPVPYIGLGAGGQLSDNIWLRGEIKYMSINAGGGNIRHHDVDIGAAIRLNPGSRSSEWYATLGYRNFHMRGEKDEDLARIGYRGPTFGIMGKF